MPPVTRSTASEEAFEFILNRAKALENVGQEAGVFAQHFTNWYVYDTCAYHFTSCGHVKKHLTSNVESLPMIACFAAFLKVLMWQNFSIWDAMPSSYLRVQTREQTRSGGKLSQ